ncbi:MAG: hypothetical protein COW66_00525 [Flavobacteriaceae bacterium CG18_big_fil_WC_8_21_14_2_50_34_36]|nr:MAG: hypothetical protein COW66_00525 [Flavobacteriaceae bacterium CG18_big_fil_WC_8_21_14_2_50_34_36]PIV49525.1 MAG: hypothetical protein COS19_08190 [Flavobacteriaceae bacterium CG02_land_8_20_14_3_00_34_13]PIZ09147.1 MAG: hypothetical protein COY56_00315 [Flavobacteriaceae bacterium CG_4_10_14_0_8_um_filter_34_31]
MIEAKNDDFLFHMKAFLSCIALATERKKNKYGAKREFFQPIKKSLNHFSINKVSHHPLCNYYVWI